MDHYQFSIIIPTYNRAHLIEATLESVLKQTFREYEIIIVDDGSTDDTENVIKPFLSNDVRYIKIQNSERGFARNFGAKNAKGRYVNFFDSDDIALENHLEVARKFIQIHTDPEIFHLNYEWVNSDLKKIKEVKVVHEFANRFLLSGNILSCNGVFLKREVALLHPFNESRDLSVSEDWDLWLRLSARYKIHLVPDVTSYIVDHNERSVSQFNESRLVKRKNSLVTSLESDIRFNEIYPKGLKKIKAHMDSYIALHAALEGYKGKTLHYFFKAIGSNFSELFTRRTLATIKHFFITYAK